MNDPQLVNVRNALLAHSKELYRQTQEKAGNPDEYDQHQVIDQSLLIRHTFANVLAHAVSENVKLTDAQMEYVYGRVRDLVNVPEDQRHPECEKIAQWIYSAMPQ